jgi:hypothetical protein
VQGVLASPGGVDDLSHGAGFPFLILYSYFNQCEERPEEKWRLSLLAQCRNTWEVPGRRVQALVCCSGAPKRNGNEVAIPSA